MPTWYPTIVQKAISMPLLTLLEKRGEYIKHSSGYSSIVRGRTYFCERGTRNVQHIYFIDTRYLKVPGYTTNNHFRYLPKKLPRIIVRRFSCTQSNIEHFRELTSRFCLLFSSTVYYVNVSLVYL